MTIGIQGEWGSGKTSLLNNLMNLLDGVSKNTTYECIWVNTWEHSLLKTPEEALISIVTDISQQVTLLNKDNKMAGQITATGKKLLSGAVRIAAGMTMGMAGQEVAGELLETKVDNSIRKLREDLESFIDKIINDDQTQDIKNIKKIVFFIDDLDRIEPKDAVKVLELLKNIFSIKHCVFVLAIDYQVIIKGLKDKFGEKTDENEREFRSFFDKIIQLPFTMPTSQYSVAEYVTGLLQDIGFVNKSDDFDMQVINEVLENTIGSNPRSIKRLINNLSLLNILNKIKQKRSESSFSLDERILEFSLVCCQVAFPKIYELLSYKPEIDEWDDDFAFSITEKKEEHDIKFSQQFNSAIQSDDFDEDWEKSLYRITFAHSDLRNQATKISRFLSLLVEKRIKHTEEQLINILNNTSATVVTSNDEKNFRKPEKRQVLSNIDELKKSGMQLARERGADENTLKIRSEFFDKLHNHLINSVQDKKDDIKFDPYRESITYYTKKNEKFRKFAVIYPFKWRGGAKSDRKNIFNIELIKAHQHDFRLPIADGLNSYHVRAFSRDNEKWFWSHLYNVYFKIEDFEKIKDKIASLFRLSQENIANDEKQLKPVELSKLKESDLLDLEKMSKTDYTYNV